MSWSDLCPAGDNNGGRYLVVHPDADVVGIVLFRLLAADRASYGRVVYRPRGQRHGVQPEAVVERVMVWMWRQGIKEVQTGAITGHAATVRAHLARCGFESGPNEEMVRRLAHSATTATSRAIYEDALDAHQRDTHPCHRFRALQRGVPDDQWQLPEPFAGAWARRRIVFFGMNPSYRAGEDEDRGPPIGTTFEKWDDFYRLRYESPRGFTHGLYAEYQRLGVEAFGEGFRLGRDALVMEAVRYRSKEGEGCTAPVIRHETRLTRRLLAEVQPRVIVAMSNRGVAAIRHLITDPLPHLGIEELSRLDPFHCELEDVGPVWIIPTPHLKGQNQVPADILLALPARIRDAAQTPP
jgi:hypothetical protein